MTDLFDRYRVIDVDTHLTEPPDVWTARMPTALHDRVPHIERRDGQDVWVADGERLGAPGYYSMAGWDGVMPASIPPTYDDIAPAMYDAKARVALLDEEGIQAQVLYPNVGGFGNGYFCASATGSSRVAACGPTTTSSPTGAASRPTGSSPSPRCRSGTST